MCDNRESLVRLSVDFGESVPAQELEETRAKARGLLRALEGSLV